MTLATTDETPYEPARIHLVPPSSSRERGSMGRAGRSLKRTLDVLAALTLLLLAGPILLVSMIAIRITSRGPALFRQTRLGQHGDPVVVLKLRTMYVDADKRRDEILHFNESDNVLFFKVKNDPRITPVGRLLRKFSIDELPQLFNVLDGSMSLVGPRPLPGELSDCDQDFLRRLQVKPGLTGLWQISGRSDLTAQEAVGKDLEYIDNWSIMLDLMIIIRTVSVVLRGSGAY